MDTKRSVPSDPIALRTYALAVTRVLVGVSTAAAIVAFFVATGNGVFARKMFGEEFGSQIAGYDATHQALGTLVIVLCGAFAWICVGRIASSLLLGLVLMGATYYFVATGPTPIVPLELAGIAAAGLIVIALVVSFVLPGPSEMPDPWETK